MRISMSKDKDNSQDLLSMSLFQLTPKVVEGALFGINLFNFEITNKLIAIAFL